MLIYGLIGYPLSHSFSPKWFAEYFQKQNIQNATYKLFPLEQITDFKKLLHQHPNLAGLNVTLPHKQSVLSFLDNLSPEAQATGAVNCIKIDRKNGHPFTTGYNTDVAGFSQSLKPMLSPHHTKALVFGNGGASKAVQQTLKKLGIAFIVVSRQQSSQTISYSALTSDLLKEHTLWIQTSPLGMYPDTEACLDIDYTAITETHLAYDLVYNPQETLFLKKCKAQGATTKNGLEMLHLQALESAKIFGLGWV